MPLGITQSHLAKELHTSFRAINELVNEKRGITTEMALKLSKFFGTSPQLWLNLQNQFELYKVSIKKKDVLDEVKHFEVALKSDSYSTNIASP